MLDRTRFEHEIAALRQYDSTPPPPGRTGYVELKRSALLQGKQAPVGYYVPDAARSANTVDVIVFFHGHVYVCQKSKLADFERTGIEIFWSNAPFADMRSELEASGRAAVLIAPTLHKLVGSGSNSDGKTSGAHGDLQAPHKFDALVRDTLAEMRAQGHIGKTASIGHIVLAAHSGGGKAMNAVLDATNDLGGKIRACWGIDSIYYGIDALLPWLKANPLARYRNFLSKNSSKSQQGFTAELARKLKRLRKENQLVNTDDPDGHCSLIQKHWASLVATLPSTPGNPKAAFELELDQESEVPAAQPAQCVADGFDLIATARSLDGAKIEQTKSAAPYMMYARKFFEPLQQKFKDRAPGPGLSLRIARDAKEFELGKTFIDHAIGIIDNVQYKTSIGATIGGYWPMLDTTMQGARYFFELAADEGVSKELQDAPTYRPGMSAVARKLKLRPCETRVYAWLKRHRRSFNDAARKWRITPLAAAGAIAWEALENPMFFTLRSVGPGKPHTRTSAIPGFGSDDTLARQVETAGYLPKKDAFDRERLLKTPAGAIEYVSAMMGAAADLAEIQGFDIRQDPAVLTAFYQAYDLNTWKAHLVRKKAKGETAFQAIDSMARWTAAKLPMLRAGLGLKA